MIRHRRIQTHGVDAALEVCDSFAPAIEFRFEPTGEPFVFAVESAQIDCIRANLIANSAGIRGRIKAEDGDVTLIFVESGSTGVRCGARKVVEGRTGDCLVFAESRVGDDIGIGADCVRRVVSFPYRLIDEVISNHFHVTPPKMTNFAALLPRHGILRSLLREMVQWSIVSVANANERFGAEMAKLAKQHADLIVTSMLLNVPNSLSEVLAKAGNAAPTRYIKRALDFMRANMDRPIYLGDIAEGAACCPRQLQIAFQAEFGETPMSMLKKMRLNLAEKRLRAGEYSNVTELALSLGFGNPGRFAAEFRQQFQVLPSQILAGKKP
jgi:AraC-like DNA-binding protein